MDRLSYEVIGNCCTVALILDKGSTDWLCSPNFDSPSISALLLDREKGGCSGFEVSPDYQISQSYVPHTNILPTNFVSEENEFAVADFMPCYHLNDVSNCYHPAKIYRYIRRIKDTPRFKIDYEPAPDYACGKTIFNTTPEHIETYSTSNSKGRQYLCSSLPLHKILEQEETILTKDEFLLLSYNERVIPANIGRGKLEYYRTLVY